MEGNYDTNSLSDLAVSLNLNLAACALKLLDYEASKDHCSIVLSFFPQNVKALFRRALAFMKLNKVLEAKSDLEAALLVEPRNKDILRELCVVKNCLAINSNGKRSIEDLPLQDPTGKGKGQVLDDEPPLKILRESGSCSDNFSEGSLTQSVVTEKCDMKIDSDMLDSDQQSSSNSSSTVTSESSCNLDGRAKTNSMDNFSPNRVLNRDHHGMEKTMFQFGKKGGGHSVLKIDECTYKKLLDGKEVSFFQQSQLSTMKLRVLKPIISEPTTSQKKKRKRRRRKKYWRAGSVTFGSVTNGGSMTNMMDDTKSEILSLSSMTPNKTIDCEQTVEKAFSSLPREIVNHHALCESNALSHQPTYFIFTSSKPKAAARVFHARRKVKRIPSRREESPGRNVYFYPGKFPRSRDVSVSCCRYFPKAQTRIRKKRKGTTFSMCYSINH